MDFTRALSLPWLAEARAQIARAAAAKRFPHAWLILSPPGLGAEHLAEATAAWALCESGLSAGLAAACGHCASCRLLQAGNHPDLHLVRREDKAQQIKIEQVRELAETLTYTSYRGGFNIGIVEGAEALNAAGANAFLKTLEEPAPNTLLIMIAAPVNRLPATIASRCQRVRLRLPAADAGRLWLESQGVEAGSAADVLALARGAPLLALQIDGPRAALLGRRMEGELKRLESRRVDVSLVAEAWIKDDLPLRLTWLENWITDRIRSELAGSGPNCKSVDSVGLPAALLKAKIRHRFELLGAVRQLRQLELSSLNVQLALESILIKHFVAEN